MYREEESIKMKYIFLIGNRMNLPSHACYLQLALSGGGLGASLYTFISITSK